MDSPQFAVTEHIVPTQHIREYPHATKHEHASLDLVIKEYRPLNNLDAEPGSVTIIATHANGFPKETYEPLWQDLIQSCTLFKIRAIWIADCSHQGASGVKNEHEQGDDPSWFDHSRDLLCMVNTFRERMVQPIVGVGHSMGAAQLVHLSIIHPRLLYSLVLIEPVIQRVAPSGPNAAMLTSFRPDLWPSRVAARSSMEMIPFFRAWDARVFDKYLEFGLRELPTALYRGPEMTTAVSPSAVTLTTTKHQEAWSYVRPIFAPLSVDSADSKERLINPELDPLAEDTQIFTRPESMLTLLNLPQLRPSVLWVYGARSPINVAPRQHEKMNCTGTGVGGSGGAKLGRVEQVILEGAAHLIPFEQVKECAETIVGWLEKEMQRYREDKLFYETYRSGKSQRDMLVLSKQWMKAVRQNSDVKRPDKEKL